MLRALTILILCCILAEKGKTHALVDYNCVRSMAFGTKIHSSGGVSAKFSAGRNRKSDFLQMMDTNSIPESLQRQLINGVKSPVVTVVSSFLLSYGLVSLLPRLRMGLAAASSSKYPVFGGEEIMKPKEHGTSSAPVQSELKWGCDIKLADRICNYNRRWAEHAGYFQEETKFLKEVGAKDGEITFFDSVTGKALFVAPKGRSFDDFVKESQVHGWPSFRDEEVVWENVRCLGDGETVSLTGTHLGHNLPDRNGNRYCINLVSIAGYPSPSGTESGASVGGV